MRTARRRIALEGLFGRSPIPAAALTRLRRQMAAPGRHYHGLDHLAELWTCHRRLSRGTIFRTPGAERLIAGAIIFHDAVLLPRRCDNEAASVRLWQRYARLGGRLPRQAIARVAAAIDGTGGHATGQVGAGSGDPVILWVLDLDLASIGATACQFRRNSSALRAEFGFRSAAEWKDRTLGFLGALANRPRIFHSPRMTATFERPARANIAGEFRRANGKAPPRKIR